MKVKEIIVNILSIIFTVMLFVMAFTFIIFHYSDSTTALKDAWSTLGSFFGGIATLTTAYVASLLFNDWRDQHRAAYTTSIADNIGNIVSEIFQKLSELDFIIFKSENIAGSLPVSFIEPKKKEEIFKNIPYIDSLCSEILFKVVNLEKEITQLQVATKYSCDNIEQHYMDFKKQVELMVGDVLKDPDTGMRYQKISKSRRFISLIEPQYKNFLRKIYTEIDNLNTFK